MGASWRVLILEKKTMSGTISSTHSTTHKEGLMKTRRVLQGTLTALVAVIPLTGCGPQLDPTPPQPLDIGQAYVGTTASKTGTWQNSGNANATITQPVFTMGGANANLFAGVLMGPVPATIAKGQTLTPPAVLVFAPTDVGQFTATATPRVNELAATVNAMTLQGEGIAQYVVGDLTVGGQPIRVGQPVNFGRVAAGAVSPVVKFDLLNPIGAQNITVTKISFHVNNQGFAVIAPPLPFQVPQGGRTAVSMTFRPAAWTQPPREKMFRDGVTFFEVRTDTFGNIAAGKSATGVALCGVGYFPPDTPNPDPPLMKCP